MATNTTTRPISPALALTMTLLTGVYLSYEIPFGALLLETVSGGADADAISRLEHAGRLIAGAALALALLPYAIKRASRGDVAPGRVMALVGAGFLAVVAVAFVAQRVLVDTIAE